jgi:hypothetical protein
MTTNRSILLSTGLILGIGLLLIGLLISCYGCSGLPEMPWSPAPPSQVPTSQPAQQPPATGQDQPPAAGETPLETIGYDAADFALATLGSIAGLGGVAGVGRKMIRDHRETRAQSSTVDTLVGNIESIKEIAGRVDQQDMLAAIRKILKNQDRTTRSIVAKARLSVSRNEGDA